MRYRVLEIAADNYCVWSLVQTSPALRSSDRAEKLRGGNVRSPTRLLGSVLQRRTLAEPFAASSSIAARLVKSKCASLQTLQHVERTLINRDCAFIPLKL
jgi:hypothetical protein